MTFLGEDSWQSQPPVEISYERKVRINIINKAFIYPLYGMYVKDQ